MSNVDMRVEGDKLVIEVDLKKIVGPSGSGKSVIIGSTMGSARIPGTDVRVGVNVYKPATK